MLGFFAFGAARLPRGPLPRLASQTIVDPDELERSLENVRARRYATALEELEPGLWVVAASVKGPSGVVAAPSIAGPTIRMEDGLLEKIGRLLVEEAAAVSVCLDAGHGPSRRRTRRTASGRDQTRR